MPGVQTGFEAQDKNSKIMDLEVYLESAIQLPPLPHSIANIFQFGNVM